MTNYNEQKENMSSENLSQATSESLRHYYLESMGIQSWQLYGDTHQDTSCDKQPATDTVTEQTLTEISSPAPVTSLASLQSEITACTKCEFSNNQKQAVFGEGNSSASLMIIVLLPQSDGQILSDSEKTLLSKMLKAIDIEISDVFITPLLKCPQQTDRIITALDVQTCSSYIKQQIEFVQPSMLFVMGENTAQCLLNTIDKIDDLRIQNCHYQQLPMMISYSPNDLLSQPLNKKKAWADLKSLQKRLQSNRVS